MFPIIGDEIGDRQERSHCGIESQKTLGVRGPALLVDRNRRPRVKIEAVSGRKLVIEFVAVNLAVINAHVTLAEDFQAISLYECGRVWINANPQPTGMGSEQRR